MGLLRICLALAVISSHTCELIPFKMTYGFFAVKIFFVISGFYMALVLNEKYFLQKNAYQTFIVNRILRLYPLYIVVFILSLIVYVLFAVFIGWSNVHQSYNVNLMNPYEYFWQNVDCFKNNWFLFFSLVFSNIFILGLDVLNFFKTPSPQIIPQAWTLSLEFYFYFMAPFLVRQKTLRLLILFMLSVCARLWFAQQGFVNDPWSFRFFPFELAFFLLGIFSYRIYQKIRHVKIPKIVFIIFLFIVLAPILDWETLKVFTVLNTSWNGVIVFCLQFLGIVIGLPVIFSYTKDIAFDRWIGEFSYPMYVIHFLVIYLLQSILGISQKDSLFGWLAASICFIISFFLLYVFIYPLERMRSKRQLSHKI